MNTKAFDARLLPIAGYLASRLEGMVIVDLNCGHARLADYLPIGNYYYIGNDTDEDAIRDCLLHYPNLNYEFVIMSDTEMVCGGRGQIDILICAGYAAGFSEAESDTLDDSIKKLISRYTPGIVIFEGSTLPLINNRLLSLRDWAISQGYSQEFNFKVDVMEEPDVWQLRNVIILEKK